MPEHRVLLLVDDVEVAIDLMVALEEDGHRVEHVFHLEDAMLRARMARYDALIVAAPHSDRVLARTWPVRHPDVPLLLIDPSPEARSSAEISDSPCLGTPIDAHQLTERLAERLGERRGYPSPPSSGVRLRQLRVLVVLRRNLATELDPDTLHAELDADCVVAADVRSAAPLLDEPIDAVLMDGTLMVDPAAGVVLRQRIHARGLPLVPLRVGPGAGREAMYAALRDAASELRCAPLRASVG